MNKLNIFLVTCFLVILGLTLTTSQTFCPPFEEPAVCADICNRCDGGIPCPYICMPGCQCIPGFTRDSNMNCIPFNECPGRMFEGNQEKISQETYIEEVKNWEDNKRGCPDEIKCKRNCRLRGLPYLDGVCTGPHKKHCHCLNCSITHDKDDSASKNGCPNLAVCINHCKMSGHNTGACIGPKRLTCDCSSIKTAEDAPAFKSSLLSPNTVRGGCPVASFCSVFCNSRGFKKGLCLGPRKEYCNCYERISSSLRGPAIDEVNKKKNKDDNGKRQVQGIKKFVSPPEPKKEVRTQEPKKKVGVRESGSCPDVGKCVTTCQAKGNTVGFCTGEGRRECKCVK